MPLTRNVFAISLLCLVGYMIGYFVWGERVPVSGGVGWDGVIYWWYATHFWTQLTTTTDSYHVNRILPSFIIRCATKALHININQPQNTAIAFMIFIEIIITLSAWLWCIKVLSI